ncbi:alpha/beta fold hydrolase [Cyanobium gracile UHCC 0139]|uniref:Alpha/beta fold hydrolase n=1 Tax=Cyanobium gracile UHCC 0139 TaxID=3110308 RepID=A0ABU5RQB1_9CYAN|nr:alpha/beta fold hydrolase [Cyanobium gracile]MEA5389934.1 alpha/beta fold hydrolase [Cyanobium gracile UHCC 0139]
MISDDGGTMTNPSKSAGVHLMTFTGTLYGTQIFPTSHLPTPVVLIIAGSGPTDRNGNGPLAGENNSLKQLAEGLADHGIASIRYDKRGIGESSAAGPEEVDLRFDTYADDAALWIQRLQLDPRFSSVTVIGHSEGSLIGMLATSKVEADAFVSIAGPAQAASKILRKQLQSRLPDPLWLQSEQILVALEQGNPVISVPLELHMLFRASVQP